MDSQLIYAQASVHSLGGVSMFEAPTIFSDTVDGFHSDKKMTQKAVKKLKAAGFQVLQVSDTTISIAGTRDVYEKSCNTSLLSVERAQMNTQTGIEMVTQYDCADTGIVGLVPTHNGELADVLEGIALAEKPIYFASAYAPTKSYWHLRVPGDISLGMNADAAHRKLNMTGRGIRAVMVDSGWYEHPYFVKRGYKYNPVVLAPGAINPTRDESGHGTAESANLFAVAPDVEFRMVKTGNDSVAAFNTAVALVPRPHVISCSWGFDIQTGPLTAYQMTLASAVANAVSLGIIVVFSAGNGHFGFPGQHPDVISAGGVFMSPNGSLQASNYASGFMSTIYPNRRVPDVSGLVGMLPKAAYIMLPVEDGDSIDASLGVVGAHPNSDETAPNDGWAAISGTSAAAPQVAGICALMKQKRAALTPAQAKAILMSTATDVTTGTCSPRPGMGSAAVVGADLATGNGLADAYKAVFAA